jgi:DNA helicase-2/ATP-dependent DNA helicase PcrA
LPDAFREKEYLETKQTTGNGQRNMINYEKHLNPEQLDVVMSEGGPILVIAGAGSGKTRALTYRVAYLIESGVSPDRILLATFTNKAARTMLSRVEMLTQGSIERLWGGTFHHIGNRILRKHGFLLGYDAHYTIIDQEDSRRLIDTCITKLGYMKKQKRIPKGSLMGDIISYAVNTDQTIDRVVAGRYPYFLPYLNDILMIANQYNGRKKELNIMDFDDLLLNVRRLLTDYPDVRREYSDKFLHILVDEYQDTNSIQAEILDLLALHHKNIMVVGDDSQSIYSFRGADFTNIICFPERYPDAKLYKLETNYRSTPEILNVANLSIINNEIQFHKELRPVRDKGVRPIYVPVRNVAQQADFVSQRIRDLWREGVPRGDIAVLYRAHFHSMELQMEMTRQGIPFEIRSGLRFFEQAHIKDVAAFIRLIVNPFDELAWKRALQLYDRIGTVTAQKIWGFVSRQQDPLTSVFSDEFLQCGAKTAVPGLLKFRDLLKNILDLKRDSGTTAIIGAILDGGYRDYMEDKYSDVKYREEDLEQFGNFSTEFDSLEEFLNELALLTNITEENETYGHTENNDKIVLSSIHQAKGLEWSTVFIIWCADGMIPLDRALKDPGGDHEERRLFYVAVTRAKDQLYFCHPLTDYTRGMGSTVLPPSRFLKELVLPDLDPEELPFDQWMVNEI